jgi:hypothetical protein
MFQLLQNYASWQKNIAEPNGQKYKEDFDKNSTPQSFALGNLVWYQDFLTICLVPLTLIKMVCTWNLTFSTFLNERILPNA